MQQGRSPFSVLGSGYGLYANAHSPLTQMDCEPHFHMGPPLPALESVLASYIHCSLNNSDSHSFLLTTQLPRAQSGTERAQVDPRALLHQCFLKARPGLCCFLLHREEYSGSVVLCLGSCLSDYICMDVCAFKIEVELSTSCLSFEDTMQRPQSLGETLLETRCRAIV